MHSVPHYRRRAAEVRRLAGDVVNADLAKQLERVAQEYEQLADRMASAEEPTAAKKS